MKKLFVMFLGMAVASCAAIPDVEGMAAKPPNTDKEIFNLVTFKAIEHNIPVKFAHAVIYSESRYHTKVKNHGAYGLGQIKCQTAKGIGFKGECNKLLDPEVNLEYSFKYLRMALDIAKDNECFAASLYQGGLGAKPRNTPYCKMIMSRKEYF